MDVFWDTNVKGVKAQECDNKSEEMMMESNNIILQYHTPQVIMECRDYTVGG